jgi:hypothetical protein
VPAGRKTGGGSRKGKPNKATADVRAAFAMLLERNVGKLENWLERVAEGEKEFEPEKNDEGAPLLDENGEPKGEWSWLRRPEPATALKLVIDLAEYHIPKLARTELAAPKDANGIPVLRVEFVQSKHGS